jgi:ABC-type dipeptide/oligopeptide/nickel transport system ATPase subunit
MQIDRALKLLNTLLLESRRFELSALEKLIIEAIWHNTPYGKIDANYEYATIRNSSSRLLKDLSTALAQPISKKTCKSIIIAYYSQKGSHIDLDAAPTEIQPFWGRTTEIAQLTTAIQTDRAKVVAIVGSGGIGKTALAARLADVLGAEFDFVIWRSLRESPPLGTLLTEIVQFLSHFQEIELPATPQGQIQTLMRYLRQHRCLVILDNGESLMEEDALAGNYRSGYQTYGDLLQTLGTTTHQSSLVITSREILPEILELAAPQAAVQSFPIQGLADQAASLLQSLGLSGSSNQLTDLGRQYQGNPLYLRIVANTILNYFNGNIANFIEADRIAYSKMTNVLQGQFDRLTLPEKLVMYQLSVHREPLSTAALATQMRLPQFVTQLAPALNSLQSRSLIQVNYQQNYTLQNVVMEFITAELLKTMATELCSDDFPFFLT